MISTIIDVALTAIVIGLIAKRIGGDPWCWGFSVVGGVGLFALWLVLNDLLSRLIASIRIM